MTELAAPQISSLMEALPGIAAVLRSPVASAMASLVRAGAGLEEFSFTDAEELLKFGVRRNLLTQEEVDRLLDEAREVVARRPAKPGATADAGAKGSKPKPTPPAAVVPAVVNVPAKVAPAKVVAAPQKPPAKLVTPTAVKVAPKLAVPAPKAGKAVKAAPKAPVKPAPKARGPVKAAPKAPVKVAHKAPVKVAHKAKTVAKGSKPATKKAPHKAPAKKGVAKGSPKKRR